MCQVCDSIDISDPKKAMEIITKAMEDGIEYEHFEAVMNLMLDLGDVDG